MNYAYTGFRVAVGTPVTRDPPRGSLRAALPHRALVSDHGGEPLLRPRVQNMNLG